MTTKTYSIHWYDRATNKNIAIELMSMGLDDAIYEARLMTDDSTEYFEIYDADDESGEKLYTSMWRNDIDLDEICEAHEVQSGEQDITVEFYRQDTGSMMRTVGYVAGPSIEEIERDIRESWDDWDYALVDGVPGQTIIKRVED